MSLSQELLDHLKRGEDWPSWLVFADYLLEQGDVRGTLIQLEHQLSQPVSERQQIKAQRDALLEKHQRRWLEGWVPPRRTQLRWRHGFVIGVRFRPGARWLQALESLVAHPAGQLLHQLDLEDNRIGPEGARALADSPALGMLTELHLAGCSLEDEGLTRLVRTPAVARLDTLYLADNHLTAWAARAMADSSHLRSLTSLELSSNPIQPEGTAALAQRPLQTLYLADCRVEDEGAVALAGSAALQDLTQLDLSANHLSRRGLQALTQSATLRNLRWLNLAENGLSAEDLQDWHTRECDVRV
jgi:uncharacterized protein (TIGR02996 family)